MLAAVHPPRSIVASASGTGPEVAVTWIWLLVLVVAPRDATLLLVPNSMKTGAVLHCALATLGNAPNKQTPKTSEKKKKRFKLCRFMISLLKFEFDSSQFKSLIDEPTHREAEEPSFGFPAGNTPPEPPTPAGALCHSTSVRLQIV
jgi:hypothetical protein